MLQSAIIYVICRGFFCHPFFSTVFYRRMWKIYIWLLQVHIVMMVILLTLENMLVWWRLHDVLLLLFKELALWRAVLWQWTRRCNIQHDNMPIKQVQVAKTANLNHQFDLLYSQSDDLDNTHKTYFSQPVEANKALPLNGNEEMDPMFTRFSERRKIRNHSIKTFFAPCSNPAPASPAKPPTA